eukprot:16444330-Heterocapsa_arctica.AAC.1
MMLYLMKSLNDGGPSLTPRLENISYSVIKDESRIYQYDCRSVADRRWKERLRCFASMICMLMKHVDAWKPD